MHIILATLLEGASVRDLLPLDKLFNFPAAQLLPLLHEIDKNLSLVNSFIHFNCISNVLTIVIGMNSMDY